MHSMQAGYLEKAQKYTDKALMQLEKLKSEWVISLFGLKSIHFTCLVLRTFCEHVLFLSCSVGLQPHPLYLPSHSTGAYYHVPTCHWPQGYCFTGGTVFH